MVSRSFSGKSWIHKQYNPDHVNFLKENFFLDDFSSKFLASRNIAKENIENFLNPTIKSTLPNPFSLIDMDKAVARTIKAIEKKENIDCVEEKTESENVSDNDITKNEFNKIIEDFLNDINVAKGIAKISSNEISDNIVLIHIDDLIIL